ncbi:hypothetical protein [Paracraurococcus lichenis]|uniref:Uncharacterized protein n=1 Tax=Paracraurococcus lichenis TaxID=3064888 RepID=A0ABT9EC47_9PROT|nr:hypothetical protein [Paracraurococcus sp. LOR1-02]MDO9713782.1 hypothetical protein [Paracraurococcus sp. LOR1-02]
MTAPETQIAEVQAEIRAALLAGADTARLRVRLRALTAEAATASASTTSAEADRQRQAAEALAATAAAMIADATNRLQARLVALTPPASLNPTPTRAAPRGRQ